MYLEEGLRLSPLQKAPTVPSLPVLSRAYLSDELASVVLSDHRLQRLLQTQNMLKDELIRKVMAQGVSLPVLLMSLSAGDLSSRTELDNLEAL